MKIGVLIFMIYLVYVFFLSVIVYKLDLLRKRIENKRKKIYSKEKDLWLKVSLFFFKKIKLKKNK